MIINGLLSLTACHQQSTNNAKPYIIELYKSRSFYEVDSMVDIFEDEYNLDDMDLKTTSIDTQGIWHHIFSKAYSSRQQCLSAKISYEDQLGSNELKVYDRRNLEDNYIDNQDFSISYSGLILPQIVPGFRTTLNYIPYLRGFNLDRLLLLYSPSDLPIYLLKKFFKSLDLPRGITKQQIENISRHIVHMNYTSAYGYSECLLTLLKLKTPQMNLALTFARQIVKAGYYEQKTIEQVEKVTQWQYAYKVSIGSVLKNIKKTYYIFSDKANKYLCLLEIKDYNDNILETFEATKNIKHYRRFRDMVYLLPPKLDDKQVFYAFELAYLKAFKKKEKLYLNGTLQSQSYFFDQIKSKIWRSTLHKFYVPANARHMYDTWFKNTKGKTIRYKSHWPGKINLQSNGQNFIAYRIHDYILIMSSSNPSTIAAETWQKWAEVWQL